MHLNDRTNIMEALGRAPRRASVHGILSSGDFHTTLHRERERCDRNSHGFALVVYGVNANGSTVRIGAELAGALKAQVRLMDDIGWVDEHSIGVLLPDADCRKGNLFRDRMHPLLSSLDPEPTCRVFAYPQNSDGTGEQSADVQLALPGIWSADDDDGACDRAVPDLAPTAVAQPDATQLMGPSVPVWKRVLDAAGALVALIVLAPLMLAVALFIRIVSPGPVLFRQPRVGFKGRIFQCYKFRTMHTHSDASDHRRYFSALMNSDTPMAKLDGEGDARIIHCGAFLRAAGIDELPQLFNVLKGEMSLVGPRPCIPYEFSEYRTWQKKRTDTVPGMTGLWQVSGKNRLTFKQMMRLDITYARRASLGLDLLIMLRTVSAIVKQVHDTFAERRAAKIAARRARRTASRGRLNYEPGT